MIEIVPNWHPVFVHFTVGLLLFSTAGYLLAWAPGSWGRVSLTVSRANLFAGVLITAATVTAGFLAFNSVEHDDPSHAAMQDHRNWALAAAALWVLVGVWEGWRAWRGRGRPSLVVTAAVLAAAVALSVTGFKGGALVFEYGLGVQSLPSTDDHSHAAGEAAHDHSEVEGNTHSHDERSASPTPTETDAEPADDHQHPPGTGDHTH